MATASRSADQFQTGKPNISYYWSTNAEHIVLICHPWRPEDGYDPTVIAHAEKRLGIKLPTILTQFYLNWGKRFDLFRNRDVLFSLEHLRIAGDMLLCGQENQGIYLWGIPIAQIADTNPPVHFVWWNWDTDQPILPWKLGIGHLSTFLDYIAYSNAFSSAAERASTSESVDAARLIAAGYQRIVLECMPPGLEPDPTFEWVLYQKDSIVIDPSFGSTYAVASSHDLLREAEQLLGIAWEDRYHQKAL